MSISLVTRKREREGFATVNTRAYVRQFTLYSPALHVIYTRTNRDTVERGNPLDCAPRTLRVSSLPSSRPVHKEELVSTSLLVTSTRLRTYAQSRREYEFGKSPVLSLDLLPTLRPDAFVGLVDLRDRAIVPSLFHFLSLIRRK